MGVCQRLGQETELGGRKRVAGRWSRKRLGREMAGPAGAAAATRHLALCCARSAFFIQTHG
eukprot:25950-Chlamydomonas_euryale.AAC.1